MEEEDAERSLKRVVMSLRETGIHDKNFEITNIVCKICYNLPPSVMPLPRGFKILFKFRFSLKCGTLQIY